jgi:hypothetical protein
VNERWQSEIDREIQRALSDKEAPPLPGTGRPLNLKKHANTPDTMWAAYNILAENDMAPEWIMMGKDLEKQEAALRDGLARAVKVYRSGLADVDRAANAASYRRNVEAVFRKAIRGLEADAAAHNKLVLSFNLKAPAGVSHRRRFDLDRERERALSG